MEIKNKASFGSNTQHEKELFKIKRDMKKILNTNEFNILKKFKKSVSGVK